MKDGFVKCAAATPHIALGDCSHNAEEICNIIRRAGERGVKLLVLPELCLTGYTCGDLFYMDSLLNDALKALGRVVEATDGIDLMCFVGFPAADGGRLYNCAAVICSGRILGVVPKRELPNYGGFAEKRQFSAAPEHNSEITILGQTVPFGTKLLFRCDSMPDLCAAVEICEDLWVPSPPSVEHALAGAAVIVNLSASDETIGKADYRRQLCRMQSARLLCAYLYADAGQGESTSDMVFAGHNMIYEDGELLAESPPFGDGWCETEIDVFRLENERRRINNFGSHRPDGYTVIPFDMTVSETALSRKFDTLPFVPDDLAERAARCEEVLNIQASGLAARMRHVRAGRLVIGISGGLDSCLALLAAHRAVSLLGRSASDILAVTMPCFGTTVRTRSNAQILCEHLGVEFREINIAASVKQHLSDIGHDVNDHNVVFENAQARERTQVLMDLANEYNGLVVGTGDLSELALGFATYNGDHMSMYGVNGSVPKTLVRYIVRHAAETSDDAELARVLIDIVETPVSPELLPAREGEIDQKTEEIVGPYELHDFFLYHFVRRSVPADKLLRIACEAFEGEYSREVILKWLTVFCRRFFTQQFKRSCLPDGPKVGSVSLSPRGDLRMPSDAVFAPFMPDNGRQ